MAAEVAAKIIDRLTVKADDEEEELNQSSLKRKQ